MHRKCFGQSELHRLAAESLPPSRTREQLLCDSVVFYAVMHLFASRVQHVVRFLRFAHFIDAVEYPSSEVIAPLCLFAPHGGMWWPAAVVACVAEGSPGGAGGKTQHFLQSIGISYVVVTPPEVADGYARTAAFQHVLMQAVFGHPSPTRRGEEQEFQSEPRPIYPPRRCITWH